MSSGKPIFAAFVLFATLSGCGDEFTLERESSAGKSGSSAPKDAKACGMGCSESAPHCNPSSGVCVECLTSAHCTGDKTVCHPTELRCVECVSELDCEQGEYCEPSSSKCTD